jgi:integrase
MFSSRAAGGGSDTSKPESRRAKALTALREAVRRQHASKLAKVLPEHQRLKRPPEYVEQLQAEFLAKVNQGDAAPDKSISLADFFKTVFAPHMAARRKVSTCYCMQKNWDKELLPRIGNLRVRDFVTPHAQKTLDVIARENPKLARQTLFRYKSLMSAVLRHACSQGYYLGPNPVSLAEVGAGKPSKVMPHYLLDEVRQLLAVLPEPAWTATAIAAFSGLRRGEIEGLMWEHITADAIRVERSMWAGKAYETKTVDYARGQAAIGLLRRETRSSTRPCCRPEPAKILWALEHWQRQDPRPGAVRLRDREISTSSPPRYPLGAPVPPADI